MRIKVFLNSRVIFISKREKECWRLLHFFYSQVDVFFAAVAAKTREEIYSEIELFYNIKSF